MAGLLFLTVDDPLQSPLCIWNDTVDMGQAGVCHCS